MVWLEDEPAAPAPAELVAAPAAEMMDVGEGGGGGGNLVPNPLYQDGAEGEEGEDAPMEVDEGEGEVLVVTDSEDEDTIMVSDSEDEEVIVSLSSDDEGAASGSYFPLIFNLMAIFSSSL